MKKDYKLFNEINKFLNRLLHNAVAKQRNSKDSTEFIRYSSAIEVLSEITEKMELMKNRQYKNDCETNIQDVYCYALECLKELIVENERLMEGSLYDYEKGKKCEKSLYTIKEALCTFYSLLSNN